MSVLRGYTLSVGLSLAGLRQARESRGPNAKQLIDSLIMTESLLMRQPAGRIEIRGLETTPKS